MNLNAIGRLIAQHRREQGLTLKELAGKADVGRSTLAALEGGKLTELGFVKIARLCAALDLVIEARPLTLDAPLVQHRHITEAAGRELTKAAVEEIVTRGDFSAWRGLVTAMRSDTTGRIARRVREVSSALRKHDARAHTFATLLPDLLRETKRQRTSDGQEL